jgi:type IV pilus assembly protein PilV
MNKKNYSFANSMKKQVGTTLIEVLVAVVVMSVGLVGLAALQTLSMKSNHSAYLRTQASFLAYDMIDRMRANLPAAKTGSYAVTETAFGTAPSGSVNCISSSCTSSDLITFDINQWKCSLGRWDAENTCATTLSIEGMLPGGDGAVTRTGNIYTVTVRWNDRDNTVRDFQVSSVL